MGQRGKGNCVPSPPASDCYFMAIENMTISIEVGRDKWSPLRSGLFETASLLLARFLDTGLPGIRFLRWRFYLGLSSRDQKLKSSPGGRCPAKAIVSWKEQNIYFGSCQPEKPEVLACSLHPLHLSGKLGDGCTDGLGAWPERIPLPNSLSTLGFPGNPFSFHFGNWLTGDARNPGNVRRLNQVLGVR